jgi:hypothetical protein
MFEDEEVNAGLLMGKYESRFTKTMAQSNVWVDNYLQSMFIYLFK